MLIFLEYFLIFFAVLLLRYFATAGTFYVYYFKLQKTSESARIMSRRPASRKQIKKEIAWSVISSVIFAFVGTITYFLWKNNLTAIYLDPSHIGYWYLPASLVIMMLIHETYYYWLHRAMHIPQIYKRAHKVHHQSLSPSPWTAFSFHPWESILEAVIVPLILIFLPVNVYVLLFYLIFMTFSSVINHLDIEIYPEFFRNSWIGKLCIDATHHHYHHKEFITNYGLHFTFWDRWMGTESKKV